MMYLSSGLSMRVLQVGANMKNGVLQKDNFKIVYVAPMKALAAEMTATFGKRLAALGTLPLQ